MAEQHPDCQQEVVNVCDARLAELNEYIEKLENSEEVSRLTDAAKQARVAEQLELQIQQQQQQTTKRALASPKLRTTTTAAGATSAAVNQNVQKESRTTASVTSAVNHAVKKERVEPGKDEPYRCLEAGCGYTGSYESVQHHVLMHHLRIQVSAHGDVFPIFHLFVFVLALQLTAVVSHVFS